VYILTADLIAPSKNKTRITVYRLLIKFSQL